MDGVRFVKRERGDLDVEVGSVVRHHLVGAAHDAVRRLQTTPRGVLKRLARPEHRLFANDAWARFINFRYGPDGNVYLIDWYDQQACHNNNPGIWDRTNGRIYKVSYRGTKPVQPDLAKLSDKELAALQSNANDWYVRHARRLLQERKAGQPIHEQLVRASGVIRSCDARMHGG